MGIIKIAVCDDEIVSTKKLEKIITTYCTKRQIPFQIDIFHSGKKLLSDNIKLLEYQIVFLAIKMNEINGLEVAGKLRKINKEIFIIFVTAFIHYSLEGYKVDAIRYLLKTDKKLELSVFESLNAVFEKMNYRPCIKKFCFQEGNKNIALQKIVYIESILHKIIFHILDKEITCYTMYETLNNISEVFTNDFVRIHQSYLVNLKFVKNIIGKNLLLFNDVTLPISRSRMKEVYKKVAIYQKERGYFT